jgi:hypothetical protein
MAQVNGVDGGGVQITITDQQELARVMLVLGRTKSSRVQKIRGQVAEVMLGQLTAQHADHIVKSFEELLAEEGGQ